ncbi:hypothetical protein JCGZ_18504 [Jatropha curcas]|uniref:Uncharacterized protein n=1 Tax=Jatropha curcas TaxID=180498 RepID=A0A067KCG8_JATCU|nr:hypothetical protein JCGZ_18504 [Jatropha curcas]
MFPSLMQKKVILKVQPILEESLAELCSKSLPECMAMADMGCSSGPNALLPLWEIIETIDVTCSKLNKKTPILQVFLNDLPSNDFNTIFRSIVPSFEHKLKKEKRSKFGPCFIAATAGSFYGRLFPPHSLHFVHSSYSIHWCSQVPEGLVSEFGIPLNKGNICIAKTSPPRVQKAYIYQFEKDFTTFLRSRAVEMVAGGGMVLTLLGKSNKNPCYKYGVEIFQLIGTVLHHMVQEGLIEESTLDSFNMPFYSPSAEEVRHVIEREGSFTIKRLEEFELSWDANIEDGNNDLVFDKWERGKLSVEYTYSLEKGIGLLNNLVISMTRK